MTVQIGPGEIFALMDSNGSEAKDYIGFALSAGEANPTAAEIFADAAADYAATAAHWYRVWAGEVD